MIRFLLAHNLYYLEKILETELKGIDSARIRTECFIEEIDNFESFIFSNSLFDDSNGETIFLIKQPIFFNKIEKFKEKEVIRAQKLFKFIDENDIKVYIIVFFENEKQANIFFNIYETIFKDNKRERCIEGKKVLTLKDINFEIKEILGKFNLKITTNAKKKLIDICRKEISLIYNELKKLSLTKTKVKLEDIDDLYFVRESDSVIFKENLKALIEPYNFLKKIAFLLKMGIEGEVLLPQIFYTFKELLRIIFYVLDDVEPEKIAKKFNLASFLVKKNVDQKVVEKFRYPLIDNIKEIVFKVNKKFIFKFIKLIYNIEYQIKEGILSPNLALDLFLIRIFEIIKKK